MYYKIENKECEVYKKLHEMRAEELKMEEENRQLINEKTGLKWEKFLGHKGQQDFNRVTSYVGFVFTEPEKADSKIWKQHAKYKEAFIPNKRTKLGREMSDFLNNGLKGHRFLDVFDHLGIEYPNSKFTFPYVEICGDVIVLFIDEKSKITDENIIEITSKEADLLLKA